MHRKVWICNIHPLEEFREKNLYEKHIKEQHATDSNVLLSPESISARERTLRQVNRPCPICRLEFTTEKPLVLQRHLAGHLEHIALLSLPRDARADEEELEKNRPAEERDSIARRRDRGRAESIAGDFPEDQDDPPFFFEDEGPPAYLRGSQSRVLTEANLNLLLSESSRDDWKSPPDGVRLSPSQLAHIERWNDFDGSYEEDLSQAAQHIVRRTGSQDGRSKELVDDSDSSSLWSWTSAAAQDLTLTAADRLRVNLHEKATRNFEHKQYFPAKDLVRLCNDKTIETVVQGDPTIRKNRTELLEMVKVCARRLFAVCVYGKLTLAFLQDLLSCKDQVFDDTRPPTWQTVYPFSDSRWEYQFDRFRDLQPSFFAHRFRPPGTEIEALMLSTDTIMPIHFDPVKDVVTKGAFSEVFRVTIHPQHHLFTAVSPQCVYELERLLTVP